MIYIKWLACSITPSKFYFTSNQPLAGAEFSIENRTPGRPTNRIMPEQHKFIAQDGAAAQPAGAHHHTTPAIAVVQRLRPVRLTTVH